jgi:hypothetical protein
MVAFSTAKSIARDSTPALLAAVLLLIYLNRFVGYLEAFGQRQQALVSALSTHEQTLSDILEMPEVGSKMIRYPE